MRFDGPASHHQSRPIAVPDDDLVCTHDLEGRILSANAAACRSLGVTAAELRKLSIRDLLPPDGACAFDDYVHALLRDGSATGMMKVETRTAGRRIWEYRNTIDNTEGAAPLVRGIARDVAAREADFIDARRGQHCPRAILEHDRGMIA